VCGGQVSTAPTASKKSIHRQALWQICLCLPHGYRKELRSASRLHRNEKKLAPSSILIAVAALRFLYKVTLHKDWSLEEIIPAPKKPQKLPIVLSPEEVLQFLSCVQSFKHRTILAICYAAGLRISEAVRLKVADIDSERMVIRVEQGKGQNRDVMLSPKLLQILRRWWPVNKPKQWLFPGDRVGDHITQGFLDFLQIGRTQVELPAVVAVFGLKTDRCRLLRLYTGSQCFRHPDSFNQSLRRSEESLGDR
jgi:integrase